MYNLTLTRNERSAIEWVGNRYWNGDDFRRILWSAKNEGGEWDGPDDITFFLQEHEAWEINDHIEEEGLPCFSDDFVSKLYNFSAQIV